MKTSLVLTFTLLFTLYACEQKIHYQPNDYSFDDEGWVMRINPDNNKMEKFFAIGSWHVPGYTFANTPESEEESYTNATLFNKKTTPINMVFVTPGHEKDYMSDKIHILNPFSAILHNYFNKIPTLPKGKDKDYYHSQYMKTVVDSDRFTEYLEAEIQKLLTKVTNDKYIFSHIDEIALGGVSRWAIPPVVGEKINQTLKKFDNNALVYVDLLGHAKGSSYLFEKRYLQSNSSMPKAPPYELATPGATESEIPLLGFFHAYNGNPVYNFNNGKYSYVKYDFETLKSMWYENLKIISHDYKGNGDVFGINAFLDFFAYPVLSGITVDAMREGLGPDIPIWLYFDGNGYAKPSNVTPEDYIHVVKCQIYTSIVHGATGILFWNDWNKTPEVFDVLLPMLDELNNNLDIIKLNTADKIIKEHLHVLIKKGKKGEKHIIATNTDKNNSVIFDLPDGSRKTLEPLEVYVSQ